MIAAGAIRCQIRRKEYPMLIHPSPLTIALFTVRVDLLFLLLTAVRTYLPEVAQAHIVAASVPVLRARGKSVRTFLMEHRPQVVLYDVTSPYRANWAALQQARAEGALRDASVIVLTGNAVALEAAIGLHSAVELKGTAVDAAQIGGLLRLAVCMNAAEEQSVQMS
jgi:CheY-like chemotaxis protein